MSYIQTISIWAVPVLFAITMHEVAHGWVASKLGDHTAKMMGRITLNPVKHIDPVGTILIPALTVFTFGFVFGWAKPVPINFNALNSPKKDMILVALAGPFANILMSIGWLLVIIIATMINSKGLLLMAGAGIFVNLLLAIFNLLPVPPLDGGRVISALLPSDLSYKYDKLESYGLFILVALIFFGVFQTIILPITQFILNIFSSLSGINLIQAISLLF
jgi:Zn-dependent protease